MRSHLLPPAVAAYKRAQRTTPVYTSEGWFRAAGLNSAGDLRVPAGPVRSSQTALAEEASR